MSFLKRLLGKSTPGLTPVEAVAAIDRGAPVVDVREPDEFAAGSIPGATNVPLGSLHGMGVQALRRAGVDLGKSEIVFVCQSGRRSANACAVLSAGLGGRARNLDGGMLAWWRAKLPVVEPSRRARR